VYRAGLLMHLRRLKNTPVEPFANTCFPKSTDERPALTSGRIPLVGVAGSGEASHAARRSPGCCTSVGHGLAARTACTSTSAAWTPQQRPLKAGQRLLMNRNVQAAVFENGAESIFAQVWPADRCGSVW
jgi:cyanophycin synthetase